MGSAARWGRFLMFPAHVERYREIARHAASDYSPDLILAIIWHESDGQPGAIGRGATRAADVPRRDGGFKSADRALGLMQVIPVNLASRWAKGTMPPIFYEDMIGTAFDDVKKQIQIGAEILRGNLLFMNRYDPALFPWPTRGQLTEQQIKLSLMGYAFGQGRLKAKLDNLRASGQPLTAELLAARWPDWGKPGNDPIRYQRAIVATLEQHAGQPRQDVEPYQPTAAKAETGGAAILIVIAVLIGAAWLNEQMSPTQRSTV